jgi:DNA-binding LytR/AlgR family response regulator
MQELWMELAKKEKESSFILEIGQTNYCLNIRKLMYVKATGKYLDIYLTDRTFYIRYQISQLEEKLENHGFLRIHKSYLVNIRYIYLLEPGSVILENQQSLPVSRHRFHEVQQKLQDYMLI